MGLFDLLTPLLRPVDQLFGQWLSGSVMLILWGLVAGFVTMIGFRKLSRQERMREVKAEVKANQKAMANFEGEMSELMPLARRTLALSFRQFGLALGPALLCSIPVIFLLVFLSNQYGYEFPETGTPTELQVQGDASAAASLSWSGSSAARGDASGGYVLPWPAASQPATLNQGGQVLLQLPLEHAVPVVHQRQWWNSLVANPAGYLPDGSGIDAVELSMPQPEYLPWGPGWVRSWLFLFFLSFLVFSVVAKFWLKIE